MKPEVVAFEGTLRGDFHATWGAAAVRIDSDLINPTTGVRTPVERLPELEERGALHRIEPAIPVALEDCESPLIIVAIRESSPFAETLSLDPGKLGGIIKKLSRDGTTYYLLRSRESLRQYARDVAGKIVRSTLLSEEVAPESLPIIRAGLALDSGQPHLNALRAYLGRQSSRTVSVSRACVRRTKDQEVFEEFFQALQSKDSSHELVYEKGITAGGGLDVDRLVDILRGLLGAIGKLVPEVRREWPFLPPVPPPRLFELAPGSAKLVFRVEVEDGQLGQRVARYLELRALEKALRGETPRDLRDDPAFENAIERVIRPSAETKVSQKALGEKTPHYLTYDDYDDEQTVTERLVVLGVFTGQLTEVGKIEILLLTGSRRRLLLSYLDNGDGDPPRGASELSSSNVQVHRLARVSLRRESDSRGHERYRLREIAFFKTSQVTTIHAVPSAIVPGAFRRTKALEVKMNGSFVSIGKHRVEERFLNDKDAAHRWLEAYEDVCREIELSDPKRQWAAATRPPGVSSLSRVLVSLWSLGGQARATVLAEETSRRFESNIRVNNTRRECVRHPGLMEFVGDDEKIVSLTKRGRTYVEAFRAAGGDTGLEPSEIS